MVVVGQRGGSWKGRRSTHRIGIIALFGEQEYVRDITPTYKYCTISLLLRFKE